MATDKILKKAIKNVLDAEYVGKEIQFTETWGFKVESYNIRTRSRFIPKKEREDYGCDAEANKFFIVEFNNTKKEEDATDSAAICLTLNPKGEVGTTTIPCDYEIEYPYSDFDTNFFDKVITYIANNL